MSIDLSQRMKWPSVAARIWSLNIDLFDLDRLEAREMSGVIGAKEHGRNRDASRHQGPQANTNPTRRDDFLILQHRASMAQRPPQLVTSFICRCDPMSLVGTKLTYRAGLAMSVHRGKAEVTGTSSNRRERPIPAISAPLADTGHQLERSRIR